MDLNLTGEFQLCHALKGLAQNFFLDLELVLISGVLVVTSTAVEKIPAAGRDAMWRWLKDRLRFGAGESRFLLDKGSLDILSRNDKRNEDGFAAFPVSFRLRIGWQSSEAIAAIDEFLNV
jgi:hypothetical protein